MLVQNIKSLRIDGIIVRKLIKWNKFNNIVNIYVLIRYISFYYINYIKIYHLKISYINVISLYITYLIIKILI